jgi:hypothetical protein
VQPKEQAQTVRPKGAIFALFTVRPRHRLRKKSNFFRSLVPSSVKPEERTERVGLANRILKRPKRNMSNERWTSGEVLPSLFNLAVKSSAFQCLR